jgi:hypothetical protein
MTKKKVASKTEASPILDKDNLLVFRVNRFVTDGEFNMIKNRLESQQTEGVKIVLVPYSVDLEEK